MIRWARLFTAAAALVVGGWPASAAGSSPASVGAADKSFGFDSLVTDVVVQPDGSMLVTEVWTYRFEGGPFNFGIRSFDSDVAKIHDFAASDALGQLAVIPPAQSVSGDWEWQLRSPTSDATVAYHLTYRVVGAVTIGSDVGDLYWTFIGGDHPAVGQMSVTIRFASSIPPARDGVADDDTTVLRGFAHGPSNGVLTVDESLITATVEGLDADAFVDVRAVAPASTFTVDGADELLPSILSDERQRLGDERDDERKNRLAWLLTPLLSVIGLVGTGLLWLTGGRERKSTEVLGEYWREPLDDPPAIALATLTRGTVDAGATIAGTLVDLAQRGYLTIRGERQERIGRDRTVHHYRWLGKPLGADLLEYEKDLLEFVFRGQTEVSSEELDDWAKANQKTAHGLLQQITGAVTVAFNERGYESGAKGRPLAVLILLGAIVGGGSFALKLYTGNGVGWAGVGVAAAMLVLGIKALNNRTQAGVEAAAKAQGLKKYLEDFSRLADAPVGHLILWERYLVYAVALGVSTQLIHGLASRLPALMADPNFGTWYVGPHGHFDGFDDVAAGGASLASASTPSSSGSGGGFSGGSSGGGGGGSAGAR
jgi:uncharacterized membrane protein